MTPFGAGEMAASSSIMSNTGALHDAMAVFTSERSKSREEAERALEAIAVTSNLRSEYSLPKTYGDTNMLRADQGSEGGSEASAVEGLVHYANLAPLMKLMDNVPSAFRVGTSFTAAELAQVPTNLHFTSNFSRAICTFSNEAVDTESADPWE